GRGVDVDDGGEVCHLSYLLCGVDRRLAEIRAEGPGCRGARRGHGGYGAERAEISGRGLALVAVAAGDPPRGRAERRPEGPRVSAPHHRGRRLGRAARWVGGTGVGAASCIVRGPAPTGASPLRRATARPPRRDAGSRGPGGG